MDETSGIQPDNSVEALAELLLFFLRFVKGARCAWLFAVVQRNWRYAWLFVTFQSVPSAYVSYCFSGCKE